MVMASLATGQAGKLLDSKLAGKTYIMVQVAFGASALPVYFTLGYGPKTWFG